MGNNDVPRYPDVQGQSHSHSSVELGLEGRRIIGLKSISWKGTVTKKKIFGTSRKAIGRTGGQQECDGELEFYSADYWNILLPIITKNGAYGYADLAWTLKIRYTERIGITKGVELVGVNFLGPDVSTAEGGEAATFKVPLDIMDILLDGKYSAFTQQR